MVDKLLLGASISFKGMDKDDHHNYPTLFDDHLKGEGVLISPHPVLRMRIEKYKLLQSELIFELKTQTNQLLCLAPERYRAHGVG